MAILDELVGEDKKYRSVEDLAKSRIHADEHITNIEKENAELREKVKDFQMQESLFERLKAEVTKPSEIEEVIPTKQEQPEEKAKSSQEDETLKDESLEEKVMQVVKNLHMQEMSSQNVKEVEAFMTETFGDKAVSILMAKAQELGVSTEFLSDVAARSPKAFKDLFGIKASDKREIPAHTPNKENIEVTREIEKGDSLSSSLARRKQIGDRDYFSPEEQRKIYERAVQDPDFLRK